MADEGSMEIPILWVGTDDLPVLTANQFVGQLDQDQVLLVLGMIAPPMLIGTPEQQFEAAGRMGYVPIRPLVRVSLTRRRLEELRDVLNATIENYDRVHGGSV